MRKNLFWLSDEQWARIEPHLPTDVRGVERVDDRRVISGIVHVLKSGCRWCDCPLEYGPSTTIYNRFVRWARRGLWENLFRELAGCGRSADTQMIDSTHVKAHRSAAGAKGGRKSRLWAVRAEGATRRYTHSQMLKGAWSLFCWPQARRTIARSQSASCVAWSRPNGCSATRPMTAPSYARNWTSAGPSRSSPIAAIGNSHSASASVSTSCAGGSKARSTDSRISGASPPATIG